MGVVRFPYNTHGWGRQESVTDNSQPPSYEIEGTGPHHHVPTGTPYIRFDRGSGGVTLLRG